jgi:hypothetical protein
MGPVYRSSTRVDFLRCWHQQSVLDAHELVAEYFSALVRDYSRWLMRRLRQRD